MGMSPFLFCKSVILYFVCKIIISEVEFMPWCPNCKTEYREGIEKCADCGSTLVRSLNEEDRVEESCSLLSGDKKHVKMIEEHLLAEGFSSAFSTPVKGEGGNRYELYVSVTERDEAVKCAAEFMRKTNPQAMEAIQNPNSPRVMTKQAPAAPKFVSANERKSDMKSSGIMLLCFGVAGLIFMVLVIFGIIPVRFVGFNAVIAYSVMGIFFGALFVSGIMSLVSAKKMVGVNEEEQKQMDALNSWCAQNLTKEIVEKTIPGNVEEEEQVYFERYDYMKQAIASAFPDFKEDFLEYYTENLYSKYFE